MKKSVILIIGLIYFGSIVFIAFFGMKITSYKPIIYVEEIMCINKELKVSKTGIKYIDFDITDYQSHFISWKVFPENATYSSVDLRYTESPEFSIDDRGLITFYDVCEFNLTIHSTDGSNKKEVITLSAQR